jgi:hypothetical protein
MSHSSAIVTVIVHATVVASPARDSPDVPWIEAAAFPWRRDLILRFDIDIPDKSGDAGAGENKTPAPSEYESRKYLTIPRQASA